MDRLSRHDLTLNFKHRKSTLNNRRWKNKQKIVKKDQILESSLANLNDPLFEFDHFSFWELGSIPGTSAGRTGGNEYFSRGWAGNKTVNQTRTLAAAVKMIPNKRPDMKDGMGTTRMASKRAPTRRRGVADAIGEVRGCASVLSTFWRRTAVRKKRRKMRTKSSPVRSNLINPIIIRWLLVKLIEWKFNLRGQFPVGGPAGPFQTPPSSGVNIWAGGSEATRRNLAVDGRNSKDSLLGTGALSDCTGIDFTDTSSETSRMIIGLSGSREEESGERTASLLPLEPWMSSLYNPVKPDNLSGRAPVGEEERCMAACSFVWLPRRSSI